MFVLKGNYDGKHFVIGEFSDSSVLKCLLYSVETFGSLDGDIAAFCNEPLRYMSLQ